MANSGRSDLQGRPASSNWLIWALIALGIGGWMYWADQQHQHYLDTTSPEQQARDWDETGLQDALDDERFP